MNILFNRKFLNYNQSSNYEGAYRVRGFENQYPDITVDFDPVSYIIETHSKRYFEKIKKSCEKEIELVGLHLTKECFEAAILAVGLTIKASEKGDFAVVRPPGHHAGREKASGFCLFNNIAISANKLLGEGKRIGLLDIDGHHGDGTQALLENQENVFFYSIHESGVFPGTGIDSKNNYYNIPLQPPISEEVYLEALEDCIQKLTIFNPDILGVSVGFDTFEKDKLLDFKLSCNTYRQIGYELKLNFTNIYAVLEGGYHDKIKDCAESFVVGVNSAINQ
ncbi:MAG TPA: hypothetical protein VMY36_01790 [Patescibacteria group bacterium]|nr:hypothetical protein [Patescibacteria group bacterium]